MVCQSIVFLSSVEIFSAENLMEEIPPVFTEKNEFEFRRDSKLIAFFGTFILSGFSGSEKDKWFSH